MDLNNLEENKNITPRYTGKGLAIAALTLGIVGLVLTCTGILPLILGIVGVVLGVASIVIAKKNNSPIGLGIAGTILSAMSLATGTIFIKESFIDGIEQSMDEYKKFNDSMKTILDSLEKINSDTNFLPVNFDFDANLDSAINDMGEAPK